MQDEKAINIPYGDFYTLKANGMVCPSHINKTALSYGKKTNTIRVGQIVCVNGLMLCTVSQDCPITLKAI